MSKKDHDRRSHIRIKDQVLLEYKEITPEELRETLNAYKEGTKVPWSQCNHPYFSQSLHGALKKLKEKDENLGKVLELIDQKLDLIINLLDANKKEKSSAQLYKVDISAMGLAFLSKQPIKVGQYLDLTIGLLPAKIFINCFGKVIRCSECEGMYKIAVKFVWISEADQDKLIEHIFQRQVLQLRLRREIKEQQAAQEAIKDGEIFPMSED